MKRRDTKNVMGATSWAKIICAALVAVIAVNSTLTAKSLYVITKIKDDSGITPIHAYNIGADGKLTFQAAYPLQMEGIGTVGIAVGSNSAHLFVTHEQSNVVQVLNATTMTHVGRTVIEGAANLAGVVYDNKRDLVYLADRETEQLYVYRWNASAATLTVQAGSPFVLSGAAAYGIALDEQQDLLYVANRNNTIRVYSAQDWSLVRTIQVKRIAISVALDLADGLLYYGSIDYGSGITPNFYLSRYVLATGAETEVQPEPDACVVGLAVDEATGLVYITTGRNNVGGGDNMMAYDSAFERIDFIYGIGNPTGVAIPAGEVGYNPLKLAKQVVGGTITHGNGGAVTYAKVGETVTYSVCFDPGAYRPSNVALIDNLPSEVDFVSATGHGVSGRYDASTHLYGWLNPPLNPGGPTCLVLTVRLKSDVVLGTPVTNRVTIYTDKTPPTTTGATVVADGIVPGPVSLDKSIVRGYAEPNCGGLVCANAGDPIVYSICMHNHTAGPVTDVPIVDTLSGQVHFITADGDGIFGRYDPVTHKYTWRYPSLAAGASACLKLLAQIDQGVVTGMTVSNYAVIEREQTEPSVATIDVKVKEINRDTPAFDKSILGASIAGADANTAIVNAGDLIAYAVRFTNPAGNGTAKKVFVVDILPEHASFVAADGDGVYGQYNASTNTYVWTYPSLAPGQSVCLRLIVRLADDIAVGSTVVNSAIIDSDEIVGTTVSVIAVVKDKSYNPLNAAKSTIGHSAQIDAGDIAYVNAGDTMIYSVCFDNSNNDRPVNDVTVLDILPKEVDFVSAEGKGASGVYDAVTHTCRWTYSSVAAGASACVRLMVRVKGDVVPSATISNRIIADSNDVQSAMATVEAVVKDAVYSPLTLTKSIDGAAAGKTYYAQVGDTVTYSICVGSEANETPLLNVAIVDSLPREVTFVSAEGDGVLGQYDAGTHTYTWIYPVVPAGASICLRLTVRVDSGTAAGTKIINTAIADTGEVQATVTTAEFKTYYKSLHISKQVVAGVGQGGCVMPGENVTYSMCIDNNDNTVAISNVQVVDSLPQHITFVSTDVNGVSGQYDSTTTYTWSFPSIAAGSKVCVKLVGRLKESAPANATVTNVAAVVGDGVQQATATADVFVCENPVRGELFMLPWWMVRSGFGKTLAVVRLPASIKKSDIDTGTALILYPGGVQSSGSLQVYMWGGRVRVFTWFKEAELLKAMPSRGRVELRVVGKLKSGRPFWGEGIAFAIK